MQRFSERTNGADLPSATELLAILEHESARRAVKYDFLQMRSKIFKAFQALADRAGVSTKWVGSYAELTLGELTDSINESLAKIVQFIDANQEEETLYAAVYDALTEPQDESESELIFVFGAASNARIERAVELFKEGIAPKVLVSGNRPFYSHEAVSEAKRMADVAESRGIPRDALILEEASITLPDNVKRSLDLMETMDWRPKIITIVATNFVLQRALMEWYKFTPWDITVKPVAAHPQSQTFTNNGWFHDRSASRLVLNEYAKLVLESKMDLLRHNGEVK